MKRGLSTNARSGRKEGCVLVKWEFRMGSSARGCPLSVSRAHETPSVPANWQGADREVRFRTLFKFSSFFEVGGRSGVVFLRAGVCFLLKHRDRVEGGGISHCTHLFGGTDRTGCGGVCACIESRVVLC